MADMFTKRKRSEIMSRIRSKNTKPELLFFHLVKELWSEGYRYRKHYKKLPGKPDLAFPREKIAIFIDSEFWHGKDFKNWKSRLPKQYWLEKIKTNIKRDEEVNRALFKLSWKVFRVWTTDFKKNPDKLINDLRTELSKRNDESNNNIQSID